ncbi:MAG: type II restriction enzyme, partial [Flavobacterium sp.]
MNHKPWSSIFDRYNIHKHDFSQSPFVLTAQQIKEATAHFTTTTEREVRVLCKQDTRESRPQVFIDHNLFILPIKNGTYTILQGEGYVDIPEITTPPVTYKSKLNFELETSRIGNSEMQHLDFAFASSLLREFLEDDSLVLTIRGRKYTPKFEFYAGKHRQKLSVESVQTEIDAGYEGKDQVVL